MSEVQEVSEIQVEPPKKSFLIWNLIGQGWQIMKKNVWKLLGVQVVFFVLFYLIVGLIDLLLPVTPDTMWYFRFANKLASYVVSYCYSIGITTMSLLLADQNTITFKDFFSKLHVIVTYACSAILGGFCVTLGIGCLIVPGVIFAARFSLFGYFIVDKNMGPIEALQASWYTVKGVTWRVLGFWIACSLVFLLGLLCLGVGVLFAFPTTAIAGALLYRVLANQTQLTAISAKW